MPDQLILGIDAAWSEKAPSGVALVRQSGERCSCLGLAPSYEAFLCLAQGQAVDWSAKPTGGTPDAAQLLDAVSVLAGTTPTVVCIDMPLSMDPISGRRSAEERVSKIYGGAWCAAHSPSATRPGRISDQLRMDFAAHGYRLATTAPESWATPCLVEVYPHPAIVRLMNLKRRLEYKVSKASKYWPHTSTAAHRQFLVDNLSALRTTLACRIESIVLDIPAGNQRQSMADLKRIEDALDALVCCWVGVEYLAGRAEPLGDSSAAIWCPGRTSPA